MDEVSLWRNICKTVCKMGFEDIDLVALDNPWDVAPDEFILEKLKNVFVIFNGPAAGNNNVFFHALLTCWHQYRYGGWTTQQKGTKSYIASTYAVQNYEPKHVYYYYGQDPTWTQLRNELGDHQITIDEAAEYFSKYFTLQNHLTIK